MLGDPRRQVFPNIEGAAFCYAIGTGAAAVLASQENSGPPSFTQRARSYAIWYFPLGDLGDERFATRLTRGRRQSCQAKKTVALHHLPSARVRIRFGTSR